MTEMTLMKALLLDAFHNAWVEAQVASATGDPGLAKGRKEDMIEAHAAIRQYERDTKAEGK